MSIFAGDIMLDIEGLDIRPSSLILTIGAVGFDPFSDSIYHEHAFYQRVDTDSQSERTVDDSTVEWWSKQSQQAQEEAFSNEDRIPLATVLDDLSKFLWNARRIWVNGPTYDISILENAYRSLSKPIPWQYHKVIDARTVYKLYPNLEKYSNNHCALDDCINQAIMVQQTLKHLNIKDMK